MLYCIRMYYKVYNVPYTVLYECYSFIHIKIGGKTNLKINKIIVNFYNKFL